MFTLYLSRVIQSQSVEIAIERDTLDECLTCLYENYWLSARVVGPNAERYELREAEYFDSELGQDCVTFSFERV